MKKYILITLVLSLLYSNGSFNYGGKVNYYWLSRFKDQEILNLPFRLFNFDDCTQLKYSFRNVSFNSKF